MSYLYMTKMFCDWWHWLWLFRVLKRKKRNELTDLHLLSSFICTWSFMANQELFVMTSRHTNLWESGPLISHHNVNSGVVSGMKGKRWNKPASVCRLLQFWDSLLRLSMKLVLERMMTQFLSENTPELYDLLWSSYILHYFTGGKKILWIFQKSGSSYLI